MCQIDVNIVKSLCSENNNFTLGCCLQQMQFILKLQHFLNGKKDGAIWVDDWIKWFIMLARKVVWSFGKPTLCDITTISGIKWLKTRLLHWSRSEDAENDLKYKITLQLQLGITLVKWWWMMMNGWWARVSFPKHKYQLNFSCSSDQFEALQEELDRRRQECLQLKVFLYHYCSRTLFLG